MENAHTKAPEECLAYFGVNENTGLTPDQFKKNLDKYGFNGESVGIRVGVGGPLKEGYLHSNWETSRYCFCNQNITQSRATFATIVCGSVFLSQHQWSFHQWRCSSQAWLRFCMWCFFREELQQLVEMQRHWEAETLRALKSYLKRAKEDGWRARETGDGSRCFLGDIWGRH